MGKYAGCSKFQRRALNPGYVCIKCKGKVIFHPLSENKFSSDGYFYCQDCKYEYPSRWKPIAHGLKDIPVFDLEEWQNEC